MGIDGIDDIIISKTAFDGRVIDNEDKTYKKAYLKAQNKNHAALIYVDETAVYVVWFAGSSMGYEDVSIYLSTLNPLEETFSMPRIISKIKGYSCQNPIIFSWKEKLIVYHTAQPGRKQSLSYSQEDALLFRVESVDKGVTWSNPILCFCEKGYFIRSKPCMFQDKLILPSYTTTWNTEEHKSCLFMLDESLDVSSLCVEFMEDGLVQPCLIKTDNGYQVYFRDRKSESIYVASSKDNLSWTTPKRTVLPNNNSGIALEYLSKGCMVIILNPTNDARYPLSLFLSKDMGKTWKFCMNLHEDLETNYKKYIFTYGPEMSYPATFLHAGKLHVVFSYSRGGICYICIDTESLTDEK